MTSGIQMNRNDTTIAAIHEYGDYPTCFSLSREAKLKDTHPCFLAALIISPILYGGPLNLHQGTPRARLLRFLLRL